MFGEIIKSLRISRDLNQVQLANEINVSKQTISNWENNNILPSIEMLVKISQFFSVSTDFLLELDNRKYIEITGLSDKQLTHVQQVTLFFAPIFQYFYCIAISVHKTLFSEFLNFFR